VHTATSGELRVEDAPSRQDVVEHRPERHSRRWEPSRVSLDPAANRAENGPKELDDVLAKPPHRDAFRPGDPVLREPPQRVDADEGDEHGRLHPGQASRPVGTSEGRARKRRTLETHERSRACRVHSQALARIGLAARVAQRPVREAAPRRGEQNSDSGIETLLERERAPQALVELEGVLVLEPLEQGLERGGKSRTGAPGSRTRRVTSSRLSSILPPRMSLSHPG